jgi:hypothetical protein
MRFKPLSFNADRGIRGLTFTVGVPVNYADDLNKAAEDFKNGLEFEFKSVKKKRSLDSNSYLWVLCDQIAQAIHSTKEEVYRIAITEVGRYIEMSFATKEDMDDFIRWWTEKGVGWIVETVDAELLIVHAYIGSSRYTTQEMSVLIENLVDSAKELGISTKSDEEIDSLIRSWNNKC